MSEFGSGIVVCLAKFSEHLMNPQALWLVEPEVESTLSLSARIELWASGASDHFYELDDSAPQPLKELAALTLKMGHSFTDHTWTMDDMTRVRTLWRESCLAIDARLGVTADWGEW